MTDLPKALKPVNPVHDSVHGRIWLTAVELDVINTPEFQRLRRISQLEPVDIVFPGATHRRFAHSLGAAHVMGMILRQEAFEEHFKDRPHMFQILRLAALLHDIGHLPFSHVGEVAWNVSRRDGWQQYAEAGPLTALDIIAAAETGGYHETLSALIVRSERIQEVINRHLPDDFGDGNQSLTAADLVARTISTLPNEADSGDVVVQNLLSSDLDCDRLDYLLRDSEAVGLTYGHVDLAYLIGNLIVANDEQAGTVLALTDKHGKIPGEHYLLCRYYHYAQLVSHKTAGAAELALGGAILELIREGALPDAAMIEQSIQNGKPELAMQLIDDTVIALLTQVPAQFGHNEMLVECARRVLERKLLKVAVHEDRLEPMKEAGRPAIHPWDLILPRRGQVDAKLDVAEKCNVDPALFYYKVSRRPLSGIEPDTSTSKAVKETQKMQARWTKSAKVASATGDPRPLVEESPVLAAISSHQWSTRRVFVREPLETYENGDRTQEFGRIREFFESKLETD
jgi:HD superfamily phosphohydrolase